MRFNLKQQKPTRGTRRAVRHEGSGIEYHPSPLGFTPSSLGPTLRRWVLPLAAGLYPFAVGFYPFVVGSYTLRLDYDIRRGCWAVPVDTRGGKGETNHNLRRGSLCYRRVAIARAGLDISK